MKLLVIGGREVVPVRLIPFITHGEYGRKTIADILAHELKVASVESLTKAHAEVVSLMAAERRGERQSPGIAQLDDILSSDCEEESGDLLDWIEPYAYRLNDERKAEVVPIAEWQTVCLKIRPIIELAHQEEDKIGIEGAKRQKWHTKTLRVIPDDAFMWKADLEKIFPANRINYSVWIDDESEPFIQAAIDRLTRAIAESSQPIKLPVIGGKEVIPVRLIPLITEPELSPKQLLECLWNPRGDFLKCLNHSPFSSDWSLVYKELEAVFNSGIGKQIEQFPKNTYVTRSDFEGHEYIVSKAIRLKLDKAIPTPLLSLAFEGFEGSPVSSADNTAPAPCHGTTKKLEQLPVPLAPVGDEMEQVSFTKTAKKRKSTKGKAKPRAARARFWSAVEAWVKSRLRTGQPGIDDFRQVARKDPGRFDLDGKIDNQPSLGVDGKKYYYCLATDAEVAERTVSNRLKEFYDKALKQRNNVTK